MKLTLAIPSLNRQSDESPPPLNTPALASLLQYGKLLKQPISVSRFYGNHLWRGSLIHAAQLRLNLPNNRFYVFANPLWQQMGMHQANIIAGSHIGISDEEARQLCEGLTAFYADEDWHFYPLRSDLWLLSMPDKPQWEAAPVWDICGQRGSELQVKGSGAVSWLALQTEIQMWLFGHETNRVRTEAKLPLINGLWLWNDLYGQQQTSLLASDSVWAEFSSAPRIDTPYNFQAWLSAAQEHGYLLENGLIFLDDLVPTEQTGDVWAYKDILEDWDTRWFAPLWQALSSGQLQSLTLCTDGENGGTLTLTPKSKWAFWKQAKHFTGIW